MDRLIIHVNYSAQQSVKHKNTFRGSSSGVERKNTTKTFSGTDKGNLSIFESKCKCTSFHISEYLITIKGKCKDYSIIADLNVR